MRTPPTTDELIGCGCEARIGCVGRVAAHARLDATVRSRCAGKPRNRNRFTVPAAVAADCRTWPWLAGRRGFSLIELLVVIGIVALLLAIAMPALTRVRALARQTVCQSRLRQWGLAFAAYAAENDEIYPHADGRDRCGDQEPFTREGIADYWFGWVDVVAPLLGETPWREHARGDYPGVKSVFQCPSARLADESLYSYKPLRNGFFSYAMNSCLELDSNCWAPYDQPGGNNMPSFLNATKIRTPSRVILLFDQLLDPRKGYGGDTLNRSAGANCGSYPKAFSARHARTRNELGGFVLYCDSHVEWKQTVWKPEWPTSSDFEAPPRDDPDWYPYR